MSDTIKAGRNPQNQGNTTVVLPRGKNYLLVVGIDKYQGQPRLYNAVKDAKDIIKVLTERYQFSKETLTAIFNEEATQERLFAELDRLASLVTENDNLLVYFSGHGEFKDNIDEGFWIPYDGKPGNVGSYVPFSILTRYIKAIKSFHTFIIADSCYSGTLFTERSSGDALNRLESRPSRWLLTAGRNEVVADGKPGDNSPFADAILWRLRNNKEERLRVSEFCNDIITDVASNAKQTPEGAPMHGVGHRGGEFMFRLKEVADKVFEDNIGPIETGSSKGTAPVVTPVVEGTDKAAPAATPEKIRNLEDLKRVVQAYVKEDDFEAAFEVLNRVIIEKSREYNTIISLQGQYNGAKRQQKQGIISEEFLFRTFNRVRIALTDVVKGLEDRDLNPKELDAGDQTMATNNTLSELERQGLQNQLQLLQKKLNFFKQQLIVINDAAQKFTLEMQIEETEKQINEAKEKLGI